MDTPPQQTEIIGTAQTSGFKKLLFDHNGRVGRKEYWLFTLFGIIYSVIVQLIMAAVIGGAMVAGSAGLGIMGGLLTLLFIVPVLYASIIMQIKRLHDLNQVGWLVLINLVPYVGALGMIIWLGFVPGTQGPNKFGLPQSGARF